MTHNEIIEYVKKTVTKIYTALDKLEKRLTALEKKKK